MTFGSKPSGIRVPRTVPPARSRIPGLLVENGKLRLGVESAIVRLSEALIEGTQRRASGVDEDRVESLAVATFVDGEALVDHLP